MTTVNVQEEWHKKKNRKKTETGTESDGAKKKKKKKKKKLGEYQDRCDEFNMFCALCTRFVT